MLDRQNYQLMWQQNKHVIECKYSSILPLTTLSGENLRIFKTKWKKREKRIQTLKKCKSKKEQISEWSF